jgi:spoIIIJ-associated protein
MSNGKKFFSGNSLEQAILQAARHFQLEPDELAYSQVERRHGFLKVRRRVVIEVDAANPRRAEPLSGPTEDGAQEPAAPATAETEAPAPGLAAEKEPGQESDVEELTSLPESLRSARERFPRAEGESAEAANEAIRHLLALGKLEVSAEVLQGEEGFEIEVWGPDEELLLEDRGRLLLSMQHLLPRLIRGLTQETTPCRVDCDNFQEIRTEQLRVLAQRAAAEVREKGRSRSLEPMSPDERRIVHLTLADDPAVETESQGSGLFKRVQVRPVRRRPRGFDPYSR